MTTPTPPTLMTRDGNWRIIRRDDRRFRRFYVQEYARYVGLGHKWGTQRRFHTYEKALAYMDWHVMNRRFERGY